LKGLWPFESQKWAPEGLYRKKSDVYSIRLKIRYFYYKMLFFSMEKSELYLPIRNK
jgi:hypothetical protein